MSPRVQRALQALADGSARTITEAASMSDLTREALSKAIKKPWVREHMISLIQQWLGVSALKASSKMDSLMNSDNPMAAFQENSETLPP